eukprot:6032573-Ditylum_brightwellii.AAC.1
MMTCQKKIEAFAHVMGTVLDFKADSLTMIAMGNLEYEYFKDIITMDKKEMMQLLYTVKVTKGDQIIEVTKYVPVKSKKKLLHVLWWHDHEIPLKANTVAAKMARTAMKTDSDAASTVTVKQ